MSSSVTDLPFTKRLKEHTAGAHRELEDLQLSKTILDSNLNREDYLLYLDLMHDVHLEIEKCVFPILRSEIPDLNQRSKIHLLENDFTVLEFKKKSNRELVGFWKEEYSTSFALGMLYVLEGSTLGGRIIYSHVKKSLGIDEYSGASYFSGYSDQTGLFWKSFIAELTAYELRTGEEKEIISGANHAFSQIKQHFIAHSQF